MIQLLIAAPAAVMRAGLEALIASQPGLALVAKPVDILDLEEAIVENRPDVVVMFGTSSIDADHIPADAPPIVVITDDRDGEWIRDRFGGPIRAVLPGDAFPEEILAAIESVAVGLAVARPADLRSLTLGSRPRARLEKGERSLSPREIEVLRMIADGLGNKSIAFRLGISDHTVKFHVASIMGKLGASSRTEAVTEGLRRGLIPL
jgi:two-component system, NarL family, response regulator YdfI